MRILFALMLALAPTAALAQSDEDAAHRADRRETEDLNRSAARTVDQRNAANEATLARYRDARETYQRQRDAWRRRFVACQAGDARACDPG
jgi:hypothetical protein